MRVAVDAKANEGSAQGEYDMEKQFKVGAPMVGTLRRRVGSKAYLFEQRRDEMEEENAEAIDGM